MLDGHDGEDDRAPQAQKEGGPSKLECYFLLHTDKGKFWVAAKDVKRVDACQLPEVLTRPASCKTEMASSRGLRAVGLTVGLLVFVTTLAGASYVDPHRDLPERLKGSLRWAIERTFG
jgi:hypothetical protein